MRIGYIQNSPIFGAKNDNFRKIECLLYGIKADLIVLPELFATGYAFTSKKELSELSETVDGETSRFLSNKSLETGSIIIAGFAEKEGNTFFNSSLIIYGGKVEGVYRKLHLFNKEKILFTPGNYPLKVYKLNGIHVGVMICFDWIFPEVCRVLALEGAQVIAHPSNLVMPFCQQSMITRCLENRIFAITANRIGTELRGGDEYKFTGGSQITSYNGSILASASIDASCIAFVEVDLTLADNKMINPFNDIFAERHSTYYNKIIQ